MSGPAYPPHPPTTVDGQPGIPWVKSQAQDPQDIVRAAENGRIETLFVSQHPAGPSAAAGDVSVSDEDSRLRDVLELATVTALSNDVFPAGEVPGGGSAAAVFRYPAQAHHPVPAAATGVLG